jgi:hypothetical protein
MYRKNGQRNKSKIWKVLGILVVIISVLIALFVTLQLTVLSNIDASLNETSQSTQGSANSSLGEVNKTVQGRYLFSGTIVMARAVERYAVTNGARDYGQPFSKLATFLPNQYDAWVADLECPVTDDQISYQAQIDNLVFNCPPDFLPEMARYFDIFNLANNHTGDLESDGFKETQQRLTNAGFQHVGNYDPSVAEDICEVVAMPVQVNNNGQNTEAQLPIAFCAWQYFFRDPLPGELEVIKPYAEMMPVFALQHAGVEYVAEANGNQIPIARQLIDNGAEFVVGNSPHWVQNTEVYKGKLIAYSTGNFIFDQLEDETNRGASFDVMMQIDYDENTAAWLALGPSCLADNDNCLAQAKEANLQKLEPKLSWKVVANTSGAGKVTERANNDIQELVEERTNWQSTLEALTQE